MNNTLNQILCYKDFLTNPQMRIFGRNNEIQDEVKRLFSIIDEMPKTYEQDGLGQDAIAHLHYFGNGFDWYILEKDINKGQHQAFGLVKGPYSYAYEYGYIDLDEITSTIGNEIDLYFKPTKVKEINSST